MEPADIDFRYWTDGQKLPLPSWGKYYLRLGAAVAQSNDAHQSLITALAVPTRSFAAVLIATGVVISKAKAIDAKRQVSPEAHFDMLSTLPIGTSVILRRGEKTVKGLLLGARDIRNNGTKMIGVQTQNQKGGSLEEWLPVSSSPKIQVSTTAWTRLPADSEKAKDVRTSRSDFVSHVFQGADLWNFVTKSAFDCLILGNVRPLVQEVTETKLTVGPRGRETSGGTLQDILRVRRLHTNDDAFRSEIFPVNARNQTMPSEEMEPHLVIFDGALGFLKWRDNWAHCDRVVVLDRTEPRFTEAVQMINEEYLSRVKERDMGLSEPPPRSVELVAFTVAV